MCVCGMCVWCVVWCVYVCVCVPGGREAPGSPGPAGAGRCFLDLNLFLNQDFTCQGSTQNFVYGVIPRGLLGTDRRSRKPSHIDESLCYDVVLCAVSLSYQTDLTIRGSIVPHQEATIGWTPPKLLVTVARDQCG